MKSVYILKRVYFVGNQLLDMHEHYSSKSKVVKAFEDKKKCLGFDFDIVETKGKEHLLFTGSGFDFEGKAITVNILKQTVY